MGRENFMVRLTLMNTESPVLVMVHSITTVREVEIKDKGVTVGKATAITVTGKNDDLLVKESMDSLVSKCEKYSSLMKVV